MKRMCITAFAAFMPLLAAAADLSGTWKLDNTFNGTVSVVHCTLVQTGAALTGTCKPDVPGMDAARLTGTVTGTEAKWGYDLVFNGKPARVDYAVALAADDSLAGSLLRNGTGSPIKGVRLKPSYFDNVGRDDVLTGGVRMIPITTPSGTFKVWTKRVGSNPRIKVLLLHGGPGATHEYFEAFDSYFPGAGIEYYYYDQLGSAFSDQPKDAALWDLPRFVEEVEQVRLALHLDSSNFYLLGHSWGGILAIEYALKYQSNLKGLVISNMVASIPSYVDYAEKTLMPAMDPKVLAEIKALEAKRDFDNPRYMELLLPNYYALHILRRPPEQWPDPVNRAFARLNKDVYIPMQGPSEMSASGKLEKWDRSRDLGRITVPTLTIGARYDTMDPAHMQRMASQFAKGRYLYCANGSHMAMYDDQQTYFAGLIRFIQDVDGGRL